MATRVKRSALLPYAAEAVFDIVNDVSRYPEFLPWCSGAEGVEANPDEVASRAADQLVDAFCSRANTLLGSACAR